MITVIDYGVGNMGSIRNMFKRLDIEVQITSDLDLIGKARKILLPGVGAFDNGMAHLNRGDLRAVLDRKAMQEKIPVLGICLGMQLMTRSSDEGGLPGLGWVAGKTTRIPPAPGLKVPHMGWNEVRPTQPDPLTGNLPDEPRFYFVHSYCVQVDNPSHSILKATHGIEFDAAFHADNLFGAQFHPEKSHRFGMKLLQNFADL